MAEPDLLLEFLIITLDPPPQFGGAAQIAQCDVAWQSREPVLGGLLLALGPFDQQPLFGRFLRPLMARCHVDTHACKPQG